VRVLCHIRGVGVYAVECQGVEVHVQIQGGSTSAQSARCASERSSVANR
jgi:hypothetical protein